MKKVVLGALVGLNVLLLAILVNRYVRPQTAMAQAVRPSDYMCIPSHAIGSSDGVVFVLDTDNHLLSGMMYASSQKQMISFASIDLDKVFRAGGAAVGPARPGAH